MPKMMSPKTTIWWVTGLTGSRTVTDGATTTGSPNVTSATAAFTSNDVGAGISGAGIPANAKIVTVTSATAVVISVNATATASNVSVTINNSFDPANPSVAKLTSSANISQAIVSGYKLGPTDSDTDSTTAITDAANVKNRTLSNYEGQLTMFREGDAVDTTSAFYRAFQFFKSGLATTGSTEFGYLVRRVGYTNTTAAAIGQEVESFYFTFSDPQDVDGDKGTPIQFTVKFHQQGSMALAKALVA
jgi:hypothetical protein